MAVNLLVFFGMFRVDYGRYMYRYLYTIHIYSYFKWFIYEPTQLFPSDTSILIILRVLYYSYLFRGCINKQTLNCFRNFLPSSFPRTLTLPSYCTPSWTRGFPTPKSSPSAMKHATVGNGGPCFGDPQKLWTFFWTFVFYYGTRMEPSIFAGFRINS